MQGQNPNLYITVDEEKYYYAVQGARLGCENCPETLTEKNGPKLIVTSQNIYRQNDRLVANDSDHSAENILPFEYCSSAGPDSAEMLNNGNLEEDLYETKQDMQECAAVGICIPTVLQPWKETKKDVLSMDNPKLLCDERDYTNSSRCFCEHGKAWIYVVTSGQNPDEYDSKQQLIEETYQALKAAHDAANEDSDWSIADVSDEELRNTAEQYVDAILEFVSYPQSGNGMLNLADMSPSLREKLFKLGNQTPITNMGEVVIDNDGNILYNENEFTDWANALYQKREGSNQRPERGYIDTQLIYELAMALLQ